jgi:hypothetical protein
MYWLLRYIIFAFSYLLIAFGDLAWGQVSDCGWECMFSGLESLRASSAMKITKFVIMNTVLAAAFYIPLMLLAWAIAPVFLRFSSFLFERRIPEVSTSFTGAGLAARWSPRSVRLLRDVVFITLYLLLMAYLTFWPSSRISYNLNGRDLIIKGELTEFGLRFYLYLFALRCIQATIYLAIARMADATLKPRTDER